MHYGLWNQTIINVRATVLDTASILINLGLMVFILFYFILFYFYRNTEKNFLYIIVYGVISVLVFKQYYQLSSNLACTLQITVTRTKLILMCIGDIAFYRMYKMSCIAVNRLKIFVMHFSTVKLLESLQN